MNKMIFFKILNNQHKNLKFTVEEAGETLPFLDVEVKLNLDNVDTWIYRKPTYILAFCLTSARFHRLNGNAHSLRVYYTALM